MTAQSPIRPEVAQESLRDKIGDIIFPHCGAHTAKYCDAILALPEIKEMYDYLTLLAIWHKGEPIGDRCNEILEKVEGK